MASVCELATARLLLCQLTVVLSAIYAALSALAPGDAIRIYDYDSFLNIKESMESLFTSWDGYKQTFPPPFVCSLTFLEHLLLPKRLS